jgi:hypothetical protein
METMDGHALHSRSHSHIAIARTTTSRASHARPVAVTRIEVGVVVVPAREPRAAASGDVQLHECSPLVRREGGNDTHSDTPLERRAHVQDKSPSNMDSQTRQQRINSDAVGAVAFRAPWREMRQRAAPADRPKERQRDSAQPSGGCRLWRAARKSPESCNSGKHDGAAVIWRGSSDVESQFRSTLIQQLGRQERDQHEHCGHDVAPRRRESVT